MQAGEQGVAQVAGVDDVVVGEPGPGHHRGPGLLGGQAGPLLGIVDGAGRRVGREGTEGDRREGQGDGLAVEGVHGHDRGTESERLAQGDVQLGHGQAVLDGEEAGGVAEDALAFGRGAGQHPGLSARKTHGQPEGPGHVEEVRRLVGGVTVDGAGQHARVVGHHGHTASAEVGEDGHDRTSEAGLDLEQLAVVDHLGQHRADGIGLAGVGRDQPEDVDGTLHRRRAPAPGWTAPRR